MLPTSQAHPPVVAPRSVASSYCTTSVAQVGLGLDVMPVGSFVYGRLPPPCLCCTLVFYGFSGISFVRVWYTAKVFLLLSPHLFDLFLYLRFG